ncbi:transposase [Bradyrhizobium sp. 76]|nr:transposase [Bradyrhizobium sp. 76]
MGQISVLTGPERRRRWSEDERCRIVAEAFAPGSCVAQVARDHDISTGLIYTWRRRLRQDLADRALWKRRWKRSRSRKRHRPVK